MAHNFNNSFRKYFTTVVGTSLLGSLLYSNYNPKSY